MTDIGKEVSAIAKEHIEKGKSLRFTVEAIDEALITLVPEDHPHRLLILDGPYAALAKVLGRDASKSLQ
jgi:hypothetical protein